MRFLPTLSALVLIFPLFFSSCSTDDSPAALEDMTNVPFTREGRIDTCLLIINNTTDFCDWKEAFARTTEVRDEYGINVVELYQGSEDTNLTVSINDIKSLETAEDFMGSDRMNAVMKDVSTSGGRQLLYLDQQLEYTKETNDTLVMYMTFKTINYNRWEKAFLDDYRKDPNRDFEVVRLFRGIEEPNHVHMIFKVNDPEYIEKTEKNTSFKMKMLAAGVVSYPVTYKLKDAQL